MSTSATVSPRLAASAAPRAGDPAADDEHVELARGTPPRAPAAARRASSRCPVEH